mmetsp:Transcript_5654/g.7759  ORF Transcript_5654/g.7759 Transcript_5654/m.7759 type:complete len:170 (-) Transcript_5654:19-528(-)
MVYISLQGNIQSKLRPGSWLPGIRNPHSEEVEWKFPESTSKETAMNAVSEAATSLDNFLERSNDKESRTIVIDTFTKAKWMDQVVLKFKEDGSDGGELKAQVECCATGFFPLIVPLAPLLNIIFCFIPFGDGGNCARTMKILQKKVTEMSGTEIESKTIRYSLTNPKKG